MTKALPFLRPMLAAAALLFATAACDVPDDLSDKIERASKPNDPRQAPPPGKVPPPSKPDVKEPAPGKPGERPPATGPGCVGASPVITECRPGTRNGLECKLCYGAKGELLQVECGSAVNTATCEPQTSPEGLVCKVCADAGGKRMYESCSVSTACEPAPASSPSCKPTQRNGFECKACYDDRGLSSLHCGEAVDVAKCIEAPGPEGLVCRVCSYADGRLASEDCRRREPAPVRTCKSTTDKDGLLCDVCQDQGRDTWYCQSAVQPTAPQACGEEPGFGGAFTCKVCRDADGRATSKTCVQVK